MTSHLLVLGARPETLEAARRLGIAVIDVQRPDVVGGRQDATTVVVDFTQDALLDAAVDDLRARRTIGAVISMTEAGLVPAARQRARLGLSGHGAAVSATLRDKAAMRAAIADVPSLVHVASRVVADEPAALGFAREVGYPLVLKPVDGAASIGVFGVHDDDELVAALGLLRAVEADLERPGRRQFGITGHLLEVLVAGPEYSVECFSFAGRHVVIGVTEKAVGPGFVERGHLFPARCTPDQRAVLSGAAVDLLTAVGVTDGPSHTEVKLTPRGPAIIESHDRPGGDRIVDLVALATGFDLEESALAWAAGLLEPLAGTPEVRQAAATAFVSAEAGTVRSLGGLAAAEQVAGVVDARFLVEEGATVGSGNGNLDRVAQVVAVGATAARARRSADAAAAALSVTTGTVAGVV
ncbi:ATP-grasp domain-containing protein [Cellulomonas sp. P5_C5]